MKKAAIMIFPQFCMQEISCLTEIFKFYNKEIAVFASTLSPINSDDELIFHITDEFIN
jgi:protein deglycase